LKINALQFFYVKNAIFTYIRNIKNLENLENLESLESLEKKLFLFILNKNKARMLKFI